MSRKIKYRCIDNELIEEFYGTLKSKMFYGIKRYDEAKLRKAIVIYINFYDNERFQESLKSMTPIQFGNHANPNLLLLVI